MVAIANIWDPFAAKLNTPADGGANDEAYVQQKYPSHAVAEPPLM